MVRQKHTGKWELLEGERIQEESGQEKGWLDTWGTRIAQNLLLG